MQVAFYKGKGTLRDKIIRKWTKSEFSHVELVDDAGVCWSSSGRDGGVRSKVIDLKNGNWEVLTLPPTWDPTLRTKHPIPHAVKVMVSNQGKKYDMVGIMFSQAIKLNIHRKKRWFCSELVAHALFPNLDKPHKMSPGKLHTWIMERLQAEKGTKS